MTDQIEKLQNQFSRDLRTMIERALLEEMREEISRRIAPAPTAPASEPAVATRAPRRRARRLYVRSAPPAAVAVSLYDAICDAVRGAPRAVGDIVTHVLTVRPQSTPNSISTNVRMLYQRGRLRRTGAAGTYAYSLAEPR